MSRRAVVAGLLAVALLASCTPGGDEPQPRATSPATSSNTPDPSDEHLRFGVLGDVATLDPYSPRASDLTYALVRPVYPSLYRFEPDGSTRASLAAGIDVSDDGAVVTLANMSWSRGGKVTASDVVASWRRAGERSGFSRISGARATGPQEVTFEGSIPDWPHALATNAFVLPKGKAVRSYAGPFQIDKRVPGLVVRYTVNPKWDGPDPAFTRVSVFSTDSTGFMLSFLKAGDLDAAWFPSTVNLAERLDAADLHYDSALGWSSIRLSLGSALSTGTSSALAGSIDRPALQEAFIRDDGRVSNTLNPEPGDGGEQGPWQPGGAGSPSSFVLAAPHGDELLVFLQRAIQLQLAKQGFQVELVELPVKDLYSRPFEGASLLRAEGAPGQVAPRSAYETAMPMFQVKSYVVWSEGLEPLSVNPTSEGPLWDMERWSSTSE